MQSKKSAAEIVGDEIRTILAGGAARGRAMDAARNLDKTGSLAAELGGDVMKWLSKRASQGQPEQTSWTPKTEYIRRLRELGYSLAESERIANGDSA
jgi:hypothetical protein